MSNHQDTLARLIAGLNAARERAQQAKTAEERRDAARTAAYLEDDILALRLKTLEPVFQFLAERGSDAWQEGRLYMEIPASELTYDHLVMMPASEREEAETWLALHDEEGIR